MAAAAVAAMAEQQLDPRVARLESDVAHIRSDIAEMKVDIRELRKDIHGLNGMIAQLDLKFTRGLFGNRIWMLLQSAAILAVLARALKWL